MKKGFIGLFIVFINLNVFSQKIEIDNTVNMNNKKIQKGLRKLTEEEKEKQLNLPRLIIKQKTKATPSAVNNAEKSAFRPIFNQTQNCCGQASGVAYNLTYEMNLLWGTAADDAKRQFPSHYTWNLLNNGDVEWGSWYFDGWDIIKDNGCPTIDTYGSIDADGDYTFWMSGYDKYLNAMKNTIIDYKTIRLNTAQGISDLKQWMYDHARGDVDGGLANFSAFTSGFSTGTLATGTPEAGKKVIRSWGKSSGSHAMTLVGYNDDICWDYNGDGKYTNDIDITGDGVVDVKDWEKGAFIVANSWGDTWQNNGFVYLMYRVCAFKEENGGLQNNQLVHILDVKEKSKIELALKVKMRHSNRGKVYFKVGINPDIEATSPSESRELAIFNEMGGAYGMNGESDAGNIPFEFGIDLSDFSQKIVDNKARIFFEIHSRDGKGELISASVIDYRTGEEEYISKNNGENIVNGNNKILIDILPAGTPTLTLSSNYFKETIDNDGHLPNSTINLKNALFSKATGTLIENTDYTITGVPTGLTAQITAQGTNKLLINFSGQATAHEKINDTDLELTFLDAVFKNNTASEVVGVEQELKIRFKNEYTTKYIDLDDITISDDNTWKYFYLGDGDAEYGGWRFNSASYPDYKFKFETYNKSVVCHSGTHNLIPLAYGDDITSTSSWYAYDEYPNQPDLYTTKFTEWKGKTAYVGIKLKTYDGEHHGWVRISVADDASSFTIYDAAYFTKPNGPIKAGKAHAPLLQFKSDTIYEGAINNNGGFENPLTAKLFNCSFKLASNAVLQAGTHYTISGLPAGLQEEITVLENNYLSIKLKGYAENHNKTDLTQVNISFLDALFDGLSASEIQNGESFKLNIVYLDEYKIVYKDIDDITVSESDVWTAFNLDNPDYEFGIWYNKGYLRFESNEREVIGYPLTLNAKPLDEGTSIDANSKTWIEPGEYPDEAYITNKDFDEWKGKDAYIGSVITRNGYPSYLWFRIEVNAEGTEYTLKEWAYNEQPHAPIKAGQTIISSDPSISIFNKGFEEPYTNDGSIEGTATIKLINDEFSLAKGTKLTPGSHFTITNLPEGLRCNLEVADKNNLKLSFIKNAEAHQKSNNCDFTIELKDVVFRTNVAANVENSTFTGKINFKEPWDIIYTDIDDITASAANTWKWFYMGMGEDGFGAWWYGKEGKLKIEGYKNYFNCYPGTSNLIPIAEGTLISNNSQEWYQGKDWPNEPDLDNENFHEWLGKEAFVGVALKNGEFWHYGWIRIFVAANASSYTVIDFAYNDQPNAPIIAGQKIASDKAILDASKNTFVETYDNDGMLKAKNHITIVNGSFNTGLTELTVGTDYTVQNLNAGLQPKLTIINKDSLSLEITGKATDHESANNKEFNIVFAESAFQGLTLDKVLNNNFAFNTEFKDAYEIVYVDIVDITCDAGTKWTQLEIMPGLDQVGAWLYNNDNFKMETYDNKAICNQGTYKLKLLEADIRIDENTVGWTSYDEYPNQLDVTNPSYKDNNGKEGYIGLQLEDEGYLFHAWIRVSVASDGKSYKILDFAYNEAPNKPIFTGAKTHVPVKPVIDFIADKTQVYKNSEVSFQDFSKYDPTTWAWTFNGGDPASSSIQHPKTTYKQTGVYDVNLTATNTDGSTSLTKASLITVYEQGPVSADFKAEKTIIKPGEAINFEETSVGISTSWEWKFEGAEPAFSNEQNPSIVYNKAGTYKVELVATNEFGSDKKIKEDYITVQSTDGYCIPGHMECGYWYNINKVQLKNINNSSDPNAKSPVYTDYSNLTAELVKGEKASLTINTVKYSSLYVCVFVDWNGDKDFEDANEVYSPVTMDAGTVSIDIDVPANAELGYTLMRIRTQMYKAVTSACSIEADRGETEDYGLYISPSMTPVAEFEASRTKIAKGEKILFSDKSVNTPENWAWELEGADETSSNKQKLYATYSTAGTYKVKLTVTNSTGSDSEEKLNYITVTENKETPVPEFSTDKTTVQSGKTVRFINLTEYRSDATFEWTFEGGYPNTSTDRDPEITYYAQGLYPVTLKVTTAEGSENITKNDLIKVSEKHKPVAEFKAEKIICMEGESIQFTDLSSNEPTSWNWVFEGGTPGTSTDQNPTITYATAGSYKVGLTATNSYGTSDAVEKTGYITVQATNSYCTPKHKKAAYYGRINSVSLKELNNAGEHDEAITYRDYSNLSASITQGENTNLSVATANWTSLKIFVFVDWNQDGDFEDANESLSPVTVGSTTTSVPLNVPSDANLGQTRIRIRSIAYSATVDACSEDANDGETEDYTLIIEKTPAPKAIFTATNTSVEEGKSVIFSHSSEGNPSSVLWTFEGGTPASSTDNNPVVTYSTAGNYDVSLKVTNADGDNTESKENYITVTALAANHTPLSISLSKNNIDENSPLNTEIGTLEAIDEDSGDSHIFSFATGNGTNDADNSLFTIDGTSLKVNTSLDFETKAEYHINIKAEDAAGESCNKAFTIIVNDVAENMPATEIILSETSVDENKPVKTVVAELTATDPDAGDTHTFALQAADGIMDADNAKFSISGKQLLTEAVFDYETKSELKINIRTTDDMGNDFDKAFTITVNDIFENNNPTAISLSNLSITENASSGIFFADISATDANTGETFTFELVEEAGFNSTNNSQFKIKGNELFTNASFDYETSPELNICIKVTDNHSGTFIDDFTLQVEDVDENNKPTGIQLSESTVNKGAAIGSTVATLTATDKDASDVHTFRLYPSNGISDAHNDKFIVDGNELKLDKSIGMLSGYVKINLKVTDKAGASISKAFEIEILNSVPTDISLSNNTIAEDAAIGTIIGEFTATDADAGDVHTFSFATGGTDNASFTIEGANLKLNTALDYDNKPSYSIKIEVKDGSDAAFEKEFSINVSNVDENTAPTDITLSNNTIAEDAAIGTVIGDLSATDADAGDTHTFSFADGGTDNDSFTIEATNLKLNTVLDYETKSSYSIKVKVTDAANATFEKEFSINISDVTSIYTNSSIKYKIYPNPCVNELIVQCKGVKWVEIFNIIGERKRIQINNNLTSEIRIDVLGLNSGIYFLKIKLMNNKEIIKKIVK